MFDITKYYRNIATRAAIMAGADGAPDLEHWRSSQKEIWLTGVRDDAPGFVTTAVPMLAAQCVEEKTHRLATAEEIGKEKARRAAERDRILEEDREMKGRNAPPLDPTMKTMVEGIAALLQDRQQPPANRSKGAN